MNRFKRAMLASAAMAPINGAIYENDPPPNWVGAYMKARVYEPENQEEQNRTLH